MSLRRFTPLLPLISIVVLLEVIVKTGIVPSYLLPSPSEVANTFILDFGTFKSAMIETALASLAGLSFSFVVGVLLAMAFQLSPFLHRAVYPYTIFFQTVPIIAIAPLLVIWFGFGFFTVAASAFIVSLFPILANAMFGLNQIDKSLLDLFKLYRVGRFKELLLLRLPSSRPQLFNGLKIAAGLSIVGAIVGEFIAGGGLGGLIDTARTQQRVDQVFAAVILSSLMGLLLIFIVDRLSLLFNQKN